MITRYIKPGQLITIDNVVYQARKKVNGCLGCDLNNPIICPCMKDSRFEQKYNCTMYGIILKGIK